MKVADITKDGKKVATIRVYFDGYELTGGWRGYQFYREWTDHFHPRTVRKHAVETAQMYLSDENIKVGRLNEVREF